MHHGLTGHLLGNIVIIIVAGIVTVVCFALMVRMLVRPGETNRHHPKYEIFGDDRHNEERR